jgi:hypothetical protein
MTFERPAGQSRLTPSTSAISQNAIEIERARPRRRAREKGKNPCEVALASTDCKPGPGT